MRARRKILIFTAFISGACLLAGSVFLVYKFKTADGRKTETTQKEEVKKDVKIGWISDVHAGKEKPDKDRGFPSFPKEYKKYLEKVFSEMKNEEINTVINTGDTTNRSDQKIAGKVIELTKAMGINMIIVKGNHDGPQTSAALGLTQYYYYYDLGDVRIIVLDDTFESEKMENYWESEYANYDEYQGFINQAQLEWLKETLKTDKKVIVAMHIPVFTAEDVGGQFLPRYAEFEKIIRESGKVKLVISGHDHAYWEREYNGIRYKSLYPLTQKTRKGTYAIINLADFSVEYRIGNE
ncbi:MAG: hypothetical protein QG620_413 [Patescibacteria group bacterium]|nr:hypothetical protein [Patescibacteria group bacterium]